MKLTINQSSEYKDVEIIIQCGIIDERLDKLISLIRLYSFSIIGKRGQRTYNIPLEDIYYFESLEDRTFIYIKDDVLETDLKLYELENQLVDTRFLRISKSSILNLEKLSSVRALLNGKYEAQLTNQEKVIISRHYVTAFKEKFGV
ncbi:histidine kinase [Desulfuribacillus stibiiarsenatis]|uniref:Histidine kinase n=1 Tax=Desulfuribacillus stibiiarsenatis TaxID=1390249 RepID=A0A1E5L224_9FIRM|nr:LytTR family DNA-binding domain-containing protein [Desulfuribacillus stibiiarsenatis]OEH84156.1 histidine kinase [Desulfuribacillus stibiiarsenatis]